MTTTETLLNCPFCGWDDIDAMGGQVICNGCDSGTAVEDDLATAVATWNRRASQAAPVSSDAFREALETIRDGYGPNHLSKFALAIASAALSSPSKDGDDK